MAVKAGTRPQHQYGGGDDDDDDDDDDLLKSILELCLFSTTTYFDCLQEPKHVAVLKKGPIY